MSAPSSLTVPTGDEPVAEQDAMADLQAVGVQGVAAGVGAVELGAVTFEIACDVGAKQADGARRGEPVAQERRATNLKPLCDQREKPSVHVQITACHANPRTTVLRPASTATPTTFSSRTWPPPRESRVAMAPGSSACLPTPWVHSIGCI